VKRARQLIEPYLEMEGVIGIYVLGSSTRPFRDELSDYDIEVVVTDEIYLYLPDEKKHVFVIDEGPPRRVDHEFYLRPVGEFEGLIDSTQDLFHYPYQHAVILHDPRGRIAEVIAQLAELPDDLRDLRMRVHYLEFLFSLGRARKTGERGGDVNLQLLYGEAIVALVKLLFLVKGSWPATRHWSEQELRLLMVPEELITRISKAFADRTQEKFTVLVDEVKQWLEECGETFHHDQQELMRWAFLAAEGKEAFARWGAR